MLSFTWLGMDGKVLKKWSVLLLRSSSTSFRMPSNTSSGDESTYFAMYFAYNSSPPVYSKKFNSLSKSSKKSVKGDSSI